MTSDFPILSLLVFFPLLGAFAVLPFRRAEAAARSLAVAFALIELALCLAPFAVRQSVPPAAPGFFLFEDASWIHRFGIRYTLGMDGISLVMVLLTAFITVIAVFVSWKGIKERAPLFHSLLLALEAACMGVFLSVDLFLFYLFWEAMLVPMLFMIGVWGCGRRVYSAVKFFLYSFLGSLLMLLSIITLYLLHGSQTGTYTFYLPALLHTNIPYDLGLWLFGGFLISFAVKFPLFPVHSWQPDAYSDAPPAGTLLLAAILSKTAGYGLIRFAYPLFPQAAHALTPVIYVVAVIGISYFAWIAFTQEDMKRLVAYSSVSHMGFIALGIAAWSPVALSGALLQMVNHAVTTGALFVVIAMMEERTQGRELDQYGGLWGKVPVLSFFFLTFNMASAGVPGLNNFIGEFLVLVGTFRVSPSAALGAFLGVVLTLVYTVRLVQEVLFGKEKRPLELHDLSLREGGMLAAMAVLVVYLGVHPGPVLELLRAPIELLTK